MSARVMPCTSVHEGSYMRSPSAVMDPSARVAATASGALTQPRPGPAGTAASVSLSAEDVRRPGNGRCGVDVGGCRTNGYALLHKDDGSVVSFTGYGVASTRGASDCTSRRASATATVFQAAVPSASGKFARVMCTYCDREVSVVKLEEHENACKRESTWCENKCGQLVERQLMDCHLGSQCPKRLVPCTACDKKFVYDTLQTHHISCPRLPVPCPNRCERTLVLPREDMVDHLDYSCPLIRLPCSFKEIGCTFKGCRRELDAHQLESTVKHLSLACDLIGQQQHELRALRSLAASSSASTNGELYWRITDFRRKLADCKAGSVASGATAVAVAGGVSDGGLSPAAAASSAVGGPSASGELLSPAFYTSPGGYKLAVSAFPNGNGSGEGEHLSLYIKVLPGEFDHVLEWPFPLTVTFTVYDQCPRIGRVNVSETFRPDPTWKHFQKPPRDGGQTLGYGYPRFMSHAELRTRSYLRDDALLVRVRAEQAERMHIV